VNRQLAAAILVSNGFLLVITLGLAYFVVGAGLRPLLRLRREIDARSWHILEPVSQHDLPVELQPIAVALNTLLSVIDDATQAQRRFLADASHQLRTPLAGLQGQLDLLSHENLPQAAHDRIVALHHATRRLSHLSSQLLALGHSDAMAVPQVKMENYDLADVVESAASVFLDRAIEKRIDLGFEAAAAPVVACPWMIQDMTYNLIDNAIVYTQAGGRITVRSGVRNGGAAVLEVEDNGPGIPMADRQRVFERFFRGTPSDGVGCGLGLAIVEQIADAHGAQVLITDPESGQGTLFRVSFPAASSATPEAKMESG
jgi:two-component system sensor histidine kinase TctE